MTKIHELASRFTLTTIVASVIALAGCASDPRRGDLNAYVAPLAQNQGRIFFFNDESAPSALVIPRVHFNAESIGACHPRSAFFIDVPPGTYDMHASNKTMHDQKMKEPSLSVTVIASEEKFVRCRIKRGLPIGKSNTYFGDGDLELVSTDEGRATSRNLAFSGSAAQFKPTE